VKVKRGGLDRYPAFTCHWNRFAEALIRWIRKIDKICCSCGRHGNDSVETTPSVTFALSLSILDRNSASLLFTTSILSYVAYAKKA
jgi:hypothetical protein